MQPFPGPSQGPGVIEQTTHLSSSSRASKGGRYYQLVSLWPGGHVRTSRIDAAVQNFLFSHHFGLELLVNQHGFHLPECRMFCSPEEDERMFFCVF
jgi:hypothetical protein